MPQIKPIKWMLIFNMILITMMMILSNLNYLNYPSIKTYKNKINQKNIKW